MKYDFSIKLKSVIAGTPLKLNENDSGPVTAGKALQFALLQDTADNAKTKLARYDLYVKLGVANEKTDFSTEEVKILKDAALVMATLVAGQLVHILDQRK